MIRQASNPLPLGRQLAFTAKAVREWFDAALAEHGGSLPMWIVLTHALEVDDPPSQRELADRMGIGGATLVRHLDRLEAEGLVTRVADPHDRRVTRIGLTDAGRRRHAELAVVAARHDAEMQALIDPDEERVFRSVLSRFSDHLSTPDGARSEPPAAQEDDVP